MDRQLPLFSTSFGECLKQCYTGKMVIVTVYRLCWLTFTKKPITEALSLGVDGVRTLVVVSKAMRLKASTILMMFGALVSCKDGETRANGTIHSSS